MTPEHWKRVGELFEAAVEREPAVRADFLAKVAAGNAALAGEVLRLLASDEKAGTFLSNPPGLGSLPVSDGHFAARLELLRAENQSLAADLRTLLQEDHALGDQGFLKTEPAAEIGFMPARRIGPYRLLHKIGQGGMGSVYLAERADEEYRKRVALKIIKRGMDTDSILGRFRRERQILASFQHPNIAMLLDGGTSEYGLPYFVMEYIEGRPLLDYCDSRTLPVRERLTLFRTICSAVQYAHQNKVIHRDLKPGNILVTAEATPNLVDFGIAKVLTPDFGSGVFEPTGMGVRPMTPEYASPEQVLGKPVAAASDIYSLGVLLYELLSGRRPPGDPREIEARFTSQAELLKPSRATSQPDAISGDKLDQVPRTAEQISSSRSTTPEVLRHQLTGDLDTIVLKAMHLDPERRYRSAQELSEDIQRHLTSLPILARKDGALYRAGRFFRRHKSSILVSSVAIACVAALLVLVAGITLIFGRPARIRSIAVLPLQNLSTDPEQEYFSEGLTDDLIARLASLEALRVISHTSVKQYKNAPKPLPAIAKELNVDAVVEGSVLRAGGRVRITAQLIEAAADRHLWAETYERDHRDILALQNEVTREIARNIKLKLNPADRQRLAVSRQVDPEAHADYLQGRFHWSKRTVPDLWTAVRSFEQAIARDPSYASAYAGLADSYALLGGYTSALPKEVMTKARAAAVKALELDERLAEAHTSLAVIAQNYDWDWQTAEREYRRAIELDPNYATAHHWYGEFLSFFGRFDEAFPEIERARQLDPHSLIIAADKGVILYFSRQYDLAIQLLRGVLDEEPSFQRALMVVFPYVEKGRFADALAVIARYPPNNGLPASTWWNPYVYGRAGQQAQAEDALRRLEEVYRHQRMDPFGMVQALIGMGKIDQAMAWLEKAYAEHSTAITSLKVNPVYDPLRGDPRFQDLMRRVGLAE
jgi:eukaryotic-like serine/threonine-protein kinase